MENRIYTYRIVTDSGFAPCTDRDLFTLACCKRDMRRVIGREYIKHPEKINKANPIWVVAVMAKSNVGDDKGKPRPSGEWCYIAKITNIMTYIEYFTNDKFAYRQDWIYEIKSKDPLKWKHNQLHHYHEAEKDQNTDWDKQHNSKECYVLFSTQYRYLKADEAEECAQRFGNGNQGDKVGLIAKRIGHSKISDEQANKLEMIEYFESLVSKGKNSPQRSYQVPMSKSCKRRENIN